jgi:hypothetical protein
VRYLDTSAFLKLLVAEDQSEELRSALEGRDDLWSSTLLDVEAHRAARRLGVDQHALVEALEAVTLVVPGETTFATARRVGPETLRALDALHLAAALELGADLEEVVTYDRRLAAGCEAVDVPVHAPGLPAGWWRD